MHRAAAKGRDKALRTLISKKVKVRDELSFLLLFLLRHPRPSPYDIPWYIVTMVCCARSGSRRVSRGNCFASLVYPDRARLASLDKTQQNVHFRKFHVIHEKVPRQLNLLNKVNVLFSVMQTADSILLYHTSKYGASVWDSDAVFWPLSLRHVTVACLQDPDNHTEYIPHTGWHQCQLWH